jgi:hypothetical protein
VAVFLHELHDEVETGRVLAVDARVRETDVLPLPLASATAPPVLPEMAQTRMAATRRTGKRRP